MRIGVVIILLVGAAAVAFGLTGHRSSEDTNSVVPQLGSATAPAMREAPITATAPAAKENTVTDQLDDSAGEGLEVATFGAGCFWCVEAVFQHVEGVHTVESGYEGGEVDQPTYKQICTGRTGHAEVARLTFDPSKVSFTQLLEVFFKTHDPTTLNQQGADRGTQYRSVIFFHSDAQRDAAESAKTALDESGAFGAPIVTEITPTEVFFKAENYHQNYFNENPTQGYCRAVVGPKVDKFKQAFRELLKR